MRTSVVFLSCILVILALSAVFVSANEDVLLNWFHNTESALPEQAQVSEEEQVLSDEQLNPVAVLSSADAAATQSADTLSSVAAESRDLLNEINYARTNPSAYAALLRTYSSAFLNSLAPVNSKLRAEAINFLNSVKPRKIVSSNDALCTLGKSYLQKLVSDNSFTKGDMSARFHQAKCFFTESLAAGAVNPRDIVMSWIIDSRDKTRANRRHLFSAKITGACAVAERTSSYRFGSIAGFYSRQKSCFGFDVKQPTGQQASFANSLINEINFARQKPKEYSRIVETYSSATIDAISKKGSATRRDAVAYLKSKVKPLKALTIDVSLCSYGQSHLNSLVSSNSFSHGDLTKRYKQAKCFFNEILAAGQTTSVRDTVIAWLVDVQDPLKTNRKAIFNARSVSGCASEASSKNYTYKRVVAFMTREATCRGYNL